MTDSAIIFDVSHIINDNYSKLKVDATLSHILFWIIAVPYVLSLSILIFSLFVDFYKIEQSSYIISFASIIIGFLINASVMLKATDTKYSIEETLKERVFANIFYTILVGILLVVMIIAGTWFNSMVIYSQNVTFWIATICLSYIILKNFIFIHFILMILVVIKAFYAVCR